MASSDVTRELDEIIDELARVLCDPDEARALVLRAGFPSADLPGSSTPRSFWSHVVGAMASGKLAIGVQTLLDEAAKQYSANAVFAAHRSRAAAPAPSGGSSRYRARVIDESVDSRSTLLVVDPVCEHTADQQWQIELRVAFRRHRVPSSPTVTANLAFAAAGAWITAEAEASEIEACSAEPSRQAHITPTRAGATRAEWSCDPGHGAGQARGFLEGNETLLLTYRAREGGSLTTRGGTTGIVFVDANGVSIGSQLKNVALRIRLWNLGTKLSLPRPDEDEAHHRILVIADHTEPGQSG